ncbi:MAG: amidohydrolase family protein [Opitutales bacterium]|nr:amidohydrolase family protein [Opitutales bacterium]
MIFDIHTHWFDEEIAASPAGWAGQNSEPHFGALMGGNKLQSFKSIDDFLRDMDAAEVERAAIQGWYFENSANCRRWNRRAYAAVKKHSDRLCAFASVNCASSDFEGVLSEAFEMGFKGAGELHDGVQGFSFGSAQFDEFCACCAEKNFAICLHLSDPRGRDYPNKVATQNSPAFDAARRNKSAKFLFAHFGGGEVFAENFSPPENVFYDCAANTFLYGAAAYKKLPDSVMEKFAFGSDYSLRLYPRKYKTAEMREFAAENAAAVQKKFSQKFFRGNFEMLVG